MHDYLPIAEQINILFEARKNPNGESYTIQQVSDATGISVASISQLRNGKIQNPQLSTLRALCAFFDVPLSYFNSDSREACFAFLNANPNEASTAYADVDEIAFRAVHLSEKSQKDLLTIIQWVQAADELRQQGQDVPPLPGLNTQEEPHDE